LVGEAMKRIACYGSLKKGFWNHSRFGNMTFVRNYTINGVQLYLSYAPYPFAIQNGGSVDVEIYDVDEKLYDMLDMMETGAGYHAVTIGDAVIWVYDNPPTGSKKFEGTNWKGEHL